MVLRRLRRPRLRAEPPRALRDAGGAGEPGSPRRTSSTSCGGNTANALAIWRVHGVDVALREAWERGAVLGGWSAGANCWFEDSVTDSYGPRLRELGGGLGFLAGSFCPHFDGEPERRPTYTRLVRDGVLPPGYAADDDAAFHFEGTELREVVTQRDGRARLPRRGRRRAAARRARAVTRVVVIASASGSGKTTLGRELARRLEVPFHELDALHHGPDWTEATAEELRARVEPLLAEERWVVDGAYRSKLGDLVLERADVVVWLDLPRRVWLPRLVRRTVSRIVRREELWNGNRETLGTSSSARTRSSLFALRNYPRRRRLYPSELAPYPHVRLRTPAAVARWLDDYSSSAISAAARDAPSVSTGR